MTSKVRFSDSTTTCTTIRSTWREDCEKVDNSCQTNPELYQFAESEIQTGIATEIVMDEVKSKYSGMSLVDFVSKKHKRMPKEKWRDAIEIGKITVSAGTDFEVQTNPLSKIEGEMVIEYVNVANDACTQTIPPQKENLENNASKSPFSRKDAKHSNDGKKDDDDDYGDDFNLDDGDSKVAESKRDSFERNASSEDARLVKFLSNAYPMMASTLESNLNSKAFDGYDDKMAQEALAALSNEASHWKTLSVDLEKKKVLFPDWSKAKHFTGKIIRCSLTRNRERVYDIEFDDSATVLKAMKEEHIRVYGDILPQEDSLNIRLIEGMRVHTQMKVRGKLKYYPGRITKVHSKDTCDVEVEGGKTIRDVLLNEMLMGLSEGQTVEARRPMKSALQSTDVSWNASGTSIAASYGKPDITGWCNDPGAVCVWNVFSKQFDAKNPEYTLDHPSCIMTVEYHPVLPAIVAAGSFNGEVIFWNLASQDQVPCVSPIADYCHKEPVTKLTWVKEGRGNSDDWLLCSAGADGRILFWDMKNQFQYPVLGGVASRNKGGSRRTYPCAYGATSIAFSGGIGSSTRPQWMVAGQEGGNLLRSQTTRIFNNNKYTLESFEGISLASRERPNDDIDRERENRDREREKGDGVFPALRRGHEAFNHESHIGSVNGLDFSPFARNLFLSCGSDGTIHLKHLLESQALRTWEPTPATQSSNAKSSYYRQQEDAFGPLTGVQFSPIRPLVFATCSSLGYIYIFDLQIKETGPTCVLEVPSPNDDQEETDKSNDKQGRNRAARSTSTNENNRRPALTNLAFNRKQRGLIAACDHTGQIHIWKLGQQYTSKQPMEHGILEQMENANSDEKGESLELD